MYKHSKRVLRVRVFVGETLQKRRRRMDDGRRTDGRQKLNVAYTKALRAITSEILLLTPVPLVFSQGRIFTLNFGAATKPTN